MLEVAEPRDPISAVVHPNPYPYYAQLRRERPMYLDSGLGLWVAATEEVVKAALNHPLLRVRPPSEPVPRALVDTPAGDVFAQLVRMNDGDFHTRNKPAVEQSAHRWALADVGQAAQTAALDLAARVEPGRHAGLAPTWIAGQARSDNFSQAVMPDLIRHPWERWIAGKNRNDNANALLTALPVQAVARLLRVPASLLDATTRWVQEFAQGIAPQASAEAITRANEAAIHLMAQGEAQGLDAVQSANRIAMMQQALDATAGLVGNTIRLLRDRPGLAAGEPRLGTWRVIVAEVARWDAPVQNTRRFAAADLTLAGQAIAQGQGVLLLLASANRDEAFNRDPDVFNPDRTGRRSMSFGAGVHGCPGEAIAIEIAAAGLQALHSARPLDELFGPCTGFRPLANARIPVFAT